MKNITKTLFLAGFMLFIFAFTSSGAERKTPSAANPGASCQEFSNPDNPTGTTQPKKPGFREKIRMIKEFRKELRKARKSGSEVPFIVLIILAILLPPIAVGLVTNWGIETLFALLLWICFIIPGIIYAFYILLR